MSLQSLRAALRTAPSTCAVLVSDTLFWELYETLELCPQRHPWRAPQDSACKKVLDALLANQQLPRSDQIGEITWHLVRHDKLRVVRCVDVHEPLADTGPGAFIILPL